MATSVAPQRRQSIDRHRGSRAKPGVAMAHVALLLHAGLAGSVVIALAVINALVDPSVWWVLWVAWAWGMALALHAALAMPRWGWLGAHAAVSGLFCVGIVGTNLALGGGPWWPWVVTAVMALLAGHWLMAVRRVPLLAAQAVTSGILLAEVVIANLLHPSDRWDAGLSIAGAMLALCLAMVGTLVVTGRRSR
ncbi:MAG TPA: hypothetical protein VNP95_01990 [Thermomicrobiales bacterium]|nr:hypothetical protein [Thermomicrobiales bacterium]